MKELSKKNLFFVGLMLFCMFFGAGNLIFPPFLGQQSGTNSLIAFAGFIISAVGLPVIAVVVVAKAKGLSSLASHISPVFAIVFTVLIYLSIGPFLGIPRTGSLAFQMGLAPFLTKSLGKSMVPLFLYTLVYFGICYWLSLTPSKLVDRLGKVLTPILLILIAGIFVCSIFKPIGNFAMPKGEYASFPFFKGFSEGYMTMDAIAALNFGIVIATTLKQMGVKKEKDLVAYSTKAGLIAGFFLIVIYAMLTYLGASSRNISLNAETGAEILTAVSNYLFGSYGSLILGITFALACLTTAVGLITSCSEYFVALNSKISYKAWVGILSVSSLIFANVGLAKILAISVPVLNAIYPMAIVLMLLFLSNNLFGGSKYVYMLGMFFTAAFSIMDSLNQSVLKIDIVNKLFGYMPLYTKGLGWIAPALLGVALGYVVSISKNMLAENEA